MTQSVNGSRPSPAGVHHVNLLIRAGVTVIPCRLECLVELLQLLVETRIAAEHAQEFFVEFVHLRQQFPGLQRELRPPARGVARI